MDSVSNVDAPPAIAGLEICTVPLGGSRLSRAVQEGQIGASWYAPRPEQVAAWRAHAEQVRASLGGTDWMTTLAPAFAATGPAAERLARAAAGGVVVTTGQQPGLFGGPMYTFSKAMSALALANVLEGTTGLPVAPVFWAATDDADWMEAAITHVATHRGLHTARLVGPATDGVAMADVPLGDLTEARAILASACGSAANGAALALVDSAYVAHATIGDAYLHLLRALLEPLGIAVLDAAHPALRTAADPFLRDALRRAPAVHEALTARSREIESAGFAPQVDVVDGLSLVFHTRTESQGDGVQRTRERIPLSNATAMAREATVGSLGANVLLRPVLERALLPTVCYLAGPGEFAYFAQVAPVAVALDAHVPVVAPRWSAELVEHEARARMDRLGLTSAMLSDPHAAEQHVARAQLDDDVSDALERLRITVDTQVRALRESLSGDTAPVDDEVVQGLARDLAHRLDRFERRLVAGVKRREEDSMRAVAAVRAALRPEGKSPERVLNIIPFLARYGDAVLSAMAAAAVPHAERLVGVEANEVVGRA